MGVHGVGRVHNTRARVHAYHFHHVSFLVSLSLSLSLSRFLSTCKLQHAGRVLHFGMPKSLEAYMQAGLRVQDLFLARRVFFSIASR